jgi:hypothetical protein
MAPSPPPIREKAMKTLVGFVLVAALAIPAVPSAAAQVAKVGTFDRTSIVVAFYRSPTWDAKLNAALAERDKARVAGDRKKVNELSKWGQSQQELAHKQLAGSAPIDNIMEMMKPMLATVAAQEKVARIVPQGSRIDKTAATVDVTERLLDQLQADKKTRQIVEQLQDFKKAHPVMSRLYMFLFRFVG